MSTQPPSRPLVSLVLETHEAEEHGDVTLQAALDAIERQTYPRDRIELIVGVSDSPDWVMTQLAGREALVVETGTSDYYPMKVTAAAQATGEIIAFVDSDTKPDSEWLECLVAAIEAGADVAVGKMRYVHERRFSRWMDVSDWGHVFGRPDGSSTAMLANAVAFRADVWKEHPFDATLKRTGACYLLAQELRAAGCRVVYVPEATISHSYRYVYKEFVVRRLRCGYDAVIVGRRAPEGTMREAGLLRLGPLAPPLIVGARLAADALLLARRRREFGIRAVEVPLVLLFQLVARGIELVGIVSTLARPHYLAEKHGW